MFTNCLKLKGTLSSLTYYTVICNINNHVRNKLTEITARHNKKIERLRDLKSSEEFETNEQFIEKTIHNFSSYTLSNDENITLSKGLDQHVPSKLKSNDIQTQFEMFFQTITNDLPPIDNDDKEELKTKLRSCCSQYEKITIPNDKKEIIDSLTNNTNIVILKLDKGKGVVVMHRTDYIQKCNDLLSSSKFKLLETDPTRPTERKLQSLLRRIKSKIPEYLYKQLYPTGSCPGKFYGTAKIHKLKNREGIDKLPLPPMSQTSAPQRTKLLSISQNC